MAVVIQRPVWLCGENPAMTLYADGTDTVLVIASYWSVTLSPVGPGSALILWTSDQLTDRRFRGLGGVYSPHPELARLLVESLTRHFPEFREADAASLPVRKARCGHQLDGTDRYVVTCRSGFKRLTLEWSQVLDRKLVVYADFPAGSQRFDLTTVICPCHHASLRVNGQRLPAEPQRGPSSDGAPSSSAFLAFAESWTGPKLPEGR